MGARRSRRRREAAGKCSGGRCTRAVDARREREREPARSRALPRCEPARSQSAANTTGARTRATRRRRAPRVGGVRCLRPVLRGHRVRRLANPKRPRLRMFLRTRAAAHDGRHEDAGMKTPASWRRHEGAHDMKRMRARALATAARMRARAVGTASCGPARVESSRARAAPGSTCTTRRASLDFAASAECPGGGNGRRAGLRCLWGNTHAGSIPVRGTTRRASVRRHEQRSLRAVLAIDALRASVDANAARKPRRFRASHCTPPRSSADRSIATDADDERSMRSASRVVEIIALVPTGAHRSAKPRSSGACGASSRGRSVRPATAAPSICDAPG